MDGGAIRTERLTLRPLRPEDAEPIARMIAEWEVIRWLTMPPHPYRLSDAEWFIANAPEGQHAITRDGVFMGVVTLRDQLGYWLGRPFHGQGYMTEAARAVLDRHFASGGGAVMSGYMTGNDASRKVLEKLGFRPAGLVMRHANSHGGEVPIHQMRLDAPAAIEFSPGPAYGTGPRGTMT